MRQTALAAERVCWVVLGFLHHPGAWTKQHQNPHAVLRRSERVPQNLAVHNPQKEGASSIWSQTTLVVRRIRSTHPHVPPSLSPPAAAAAAALCQAPWVRVSAMPSVWLLLRLTWLPASTSLTARWWTTTRECVEGHTGRHNTAAEVVGCRGSLQQQQLHGGRGFGTGRHPVSLGSGWHIEWAG